MPYFEVKVHMPSSVNHEHLKFKKTRHPEKRKVLCSTSNGTVYYIITKCLIIKKKTQIPISIRKNTNRSVSGLSAPSPAQFSYYSVIYIRITSNLQYTTMFSGCNRIMVSFSHQGKQIISAKFLKMSQKARFNGGIISQTEEITQFATLWSSADYSSESMKHISYKGEKINKIPIQQPDAWTCLPLLTYRCSSFYST